MANFLRAATSLLRPHACAGAPAARHSAGRSPSRIFDITAWATQGPAAPSPPPSSRAQGVVVDRSLWGDRPHDRRPVRQGMAARSACGLTWRAALEAPGRRQMIQSRQIILNLTWRATLEALGVGREISAAGGRRRPELGAGPPEQAAAIRTWIDTDRRRPAAGLRAAAPAAAPAAARAPGRAAGPKPLGRGLGAEPRSDRRRRGPAGPKPLT